MTYGPATERKIEDVRDALGRYGEDSLVVLSGVAGTGKTLIALAAAQRYAGHPLLVKEIQFHQAYGYEDFIEGLRPTAAGGFELKEGIFLGWNEAAKRDPEHHYVLLIEEFTRANITAVLGELMTYLEHRARAFETPLSRRRISVATNLAVVATMNPRDRSALEVDDALIRRLRIIDCPPDTEQLREMLEGSLDGGGKGPGELEIIQRLVALFNECEKRHPETYREMMPFGHGMFAGVKTERDLHRLWYHRIKHLLRRPLVMPHPFSKTIEEFYPWKDSKLAGADSAAPAGEAKPPVAAS